MSTFHSSFQVMSCAFGEANDSTFFDQLWSALISYSRRFKKFEVAGRHLVYRFCDLNLRFGLHRVRLSMHILRSVCLSQRIIRTHPSHSRHPCVTEWVSASAVVLILGVLMGTSLRYIENYWDITFLQFQPKASGIRKHCSLHARDTSRFARSDRTANFWICSLNLGISNVINELGSINSLHRSFTWKNWTISRKKPELGRQLSLLRGRAQNHLWPAGLALHAQWTSQVYNGHHWRPVKKCKERLHWLHLAKACKKNKTARSLEHGNRRKM